MKKAILSVTNDLITDQRIQRTALALQKSGYVVVMVGRAKKNSLPIESKSYSQIRFTLFFQKSFFFYAEYNLRLLFFLLFNKVDLLYANDLDTLLPNFLIAKLYRSKLIYDAHEYFTGVPELEHKPVVQAVWKWLERKMFPRLKTVITVNSSIAVLYRKEYGNTVHVVRNMPLLREEVALMSREELGIEKNSRIIVYQGAGINKDRGLEEAIIAMTKVKDAILLIIGGGDVIDELRQLCNKLQLNSKIIFTGMVSPAQLKSITPLAEIGLSLDKNTNINYRFSLPNKLFDYIHAQVPVLISDLKEPAKIIKQFQVGEIVESVESEVIAKHLNSILSNPEQLKLWKENCFKASQILNWQNEEKVLLDLLSKVG